MMNFRRYAVPVLMALVASHQLYRVQFEDLVSWRWGGFGMYGSFHPRQHEAWVTQTGDGQRVRFMKYDDNETQLFRTIRFLMTWPNQDRLNQAFDEVNSEGSVISDLSVYRLNLDPETCLLSRKLLASAPQVDE